MSQTKTKQTKKLKCGQNTWVDVSPKNMHQWLRITESILNVINWGYAIQMPTENIWGKGVEELGFLLIGMQNISATITISLITPQKLSTESPTWHSNPISICVYPQTGSQPQIFLKAEVVLVFVVGWIHEQNVVNCFRMMVLHLHQISCACLQTFIIVGLVSCWHSSLTREQRVIATSLECPALPPNHLYAILP